MLIHPDKLSIYLADILKTEELVELVSDPFSFSAAYYKWRNKLETVEENGVTYYVHNSKRELLDDEEFYKESGAEIVSTQSILSHLKENP